MDEFNNGNKDNSLEPNTERPIYQNQNPQTPPQPVYPNYQQYEPRKKKGGMAGIIISIVIVCLLIGGLVSAYFIVPLINGAGWNAKGAQQQAQAPNSAQTVPAPTQSPAPTPSVSVPALGGQAPAIDYTNNPVVQIAEKVGPSVVGIVGSIRQFEPGTNSAEQPYSYGSGIILSKDGYILTNNHVIAGSDILKVKLSGEPSNKNYDATVVGKDPYSDLAVLKINADNLMPAPIGDSTKIKVGESVVAIGNPLGEQYAGTVTTGIVSALDRQVGDSPMKFIQTDAAINPGNSGGALVNFAGEVIGINTQKSYIAGYDEYGQQISTEGIGFAISISDAMPLVQQIIQNKGVKRPGIGVGIYEITEDDAKSWQCPQGVLVRAVYATGTARNAGVKKYDIITAVDDKAIATAKELTDAVKAKNIGDTVKLTIWRNGSTLELPVQIGDLNQMTETETQQQQ